MNPLISSSNTPAPDWDWVLDKPHPCDPERHPWRNGSKTQSQSGASSFRENEGIIEDSTSIRKVASVMVSTSLDSDFERCSHELAEDAETMTDSKKVYENNI